LKYNNLLANWSHGDFAGGQLLYLQIMLVAALETCCANALPSVFILNLAGIKITSNCTNRPDFYANIRFIGRESVVECFRSPDLDSATVLGVADFVVG